MLIRLAGDALCDLEPLPLQDELGGGPARCALRV